MKEIHILGLKSKHYTIDRAFNALKKDYGKNCCFLGGKVKPKNPLTYHHIFKYVYGDYSKEYPLYNYINGALLCALEHSILNAIETNNIKLLREINDGFIEYKETRMYPIIRQMREYAYQWLEKSEYEIVEGREVYFVRKKREKGRK